MFIISANLKEPLLIYPVGSNCAMFERSCFTYPNLIKAVGLYSNVSECIQISMKRLYITRILMKPFEVTQI